MKKAEIIREMRKGTQAPTIVCWGRGNWELSWTAPMVENFQGVFFTRTPAIDFSSQREARNWLNEAMQEKGFAPVSAPRAHKEIKEIKEKSEIEKMIEKFSITLHNGGKNIKIIGEYNKAELVFLKTRKQEIIDFIKEKEEKEEEEKEKEYMNRAYNGIARKEFESFKKPYSGFIFRGQEYRIYSSEYTLFIGKGDSVFRGKSWVKIGSKEETPISSLEMDMLKAYNVLEHRFEHDSKIYKETRGF